MNAKLLFSIRLIKHLSIFLFISVPLQLIGVLLLLPITACYDIGELPKILRWFDSADPFIGRDTSVIKQINRGTSKYYPHPTLEERTKLRLTLDKYLWLAWRNPTNYFEYKYLGVQAILAFPPVVYRTYLNNNDIGKEIGDHRNDAPGYEYIEMQINNKIYYEYYAIIPMNYPLIKKKALRFRMGHKLLGTRNWEWVQHAFVFNPVHPYEPESKL